MSMNGSGGGGGSVKSALSREETHHNTPTEPPGILRDPSIPRKWNTDIPHILPHERVFPIQIGSELFRLSGASLSSDAPSYFSQYFLCQLKAAGGNEAENPIRTLYIDRDPVTFKDISLHLQGYHVSPRDASHFVKLFADAQFYSLPRLISQLYEESIFITIGHREFQVPRELFSDPGNSPNYFSLGFAVFFSSPTEVFPGLNREGLLRPPSILPPSVPNRSADTFAEILHLLRGYPLHIRNEDHRAELLRDCRYFHLKGLEQKLIRHTISFNLSRSRSEITLRLEDVRQSGISILTDPSLTSPSPSPQSTPIPHNPYPPLPLSGYVAYARPFADPKSHELILEIGDECTKFHLGSSRLEFTGDGKARVSRLFEVIATKLNMPNSQPLGLLMKMGGRTSQPASPGNTGISEDWVRCLVGSDAGVILDGREWKGDLNSNNETERGMSSAGSSVAGEGLENEHLRKRRRIDGGGGNGGGLGGNGGGWFIGGNGSVTGSMAYEEREKDQTWIIKRGQWRLRIQGLGAMRGGKAAVECVMVAVRLDAVSGEGGRNAQRGFLGP